MKITLGVDGKLPEVPEELPAEVKVTEVCKGLKTWENPINKFFVARLHYSADPSKRTPEWKEKTRAGMSWVAWLREYEIVWSSFEGVPVYLDDWSRDFHLSKSPLVWSYSYPVVRGWDFGLSADGMAVVFAQLFPQSRLMVFKELTASNMSLERFVEEVARYSLEWFPGCGRFFDVIDPSGFYNRSQLDKRTCADILRQMPLRANPMPGAKGILERRRSVVGFLKRNVKGLSAFVMDPECKMLSDGFNGGYHYAFKKDGSLHEDASKNEYSHPADALQMITSRITSLDLNSRIPVTIGGPTYKFGEAGVRA